MPPCSRPCRIRRARCTSASSPASRPSTPDRRPTCCAPRWPPSIGGCAAASPRRPCPGSSSPPTDRATSSTRRATLAEASAPPRSTSPSPCCRAWARTVSPSAACSARRFRSTRPPWPSAIPTTTRFVAQWCAATDAAVTSGVILPADAERLKAVAERRADQSLSGPAPLSHPLAKVVPWHADRRTAPITDLSDDDDDDPAPMRDPTGDGPPSIGSSEPSATRGRSGCTACGSTSCSSVERSPSGSWPRPTVTWPRRRSAGDAWCGASSSATSPSPVRARCGTAVRARCCSGSAGLGASRSPILNRSSDGRPGPGRFGSSAVEMPSPSCST